MMPKASGSGADGLRRAAWNWLAQLVIQSGFRRHWRLAERRLAERGPGQGRPLSWSPGRAAGCRHIRDVWTRSISGERAHALHQLQGSDEQPWSHTPDRERRANTVDLQGPRGPLLVQTRHTIREGHQPGRRRLRSGRSARISRLRSGRQTSAASPVCALQFSDAAARSSRTPRAATSPCASTNPTGRTIDHAGDVTIGLYRAGALVWGAEP